MLIGILGVIGYIKYASQFSVLRRVAVSNFAAVCINIVHVKQIITHQVSHQMGLYCSHIINNSMWEYFNNIIEFCKQYPGWALLFFICGYIIGLTYF